MSSDDSFSDENLDKSSPIRSSNRTLRSSSTSSKSFDKISTEPKQKSHPFANTNKQQPFLQTTNTSRSLQKIRLSIER